MKTYLNISVLLFCVVSSIYCQTEQPANKLTKTIGNLTGGFLEAVEWYDIPIGLAYFSARYINEQKIGNTFYVPPAGFDEDVNLGIRVQGSQSFGSIDKDYFPNAVFFGRLVYTTSLGLFTNKKISDRTFREIFLFKKALIYTYTLTEYTKTFVKRVRPNGADTRSFFSGHTSTTFAASTYLFLELNQFFNDWKITSENETLRNLFKFSSFGVLYGWASYVGYSRMRDNKHYLSDVLIGAAVGTLTSIFVYNLYHDEDDFINHFSIYPSSNQTMNLAFNLKF